MSNLREPGTGLRQRNVSKRRNAILDAALQVLDSEPAANVTVERLAAIAEVSPATVYNLVGGRDDVLRAVMVRIIEQIGAELRQPAANGRVPVDDLWMSRLGIDRRCELLLERPDAYRRLVAHLGGLGARSMVLQGSDGKRHDAANLHIESMAHAQKKRMIRRNLNPVLLGTLVANGYNGGVLRWASGGIDDAHLRAFGRLGLISIAASACTPTHRARLEREIAATSRELTGK